ncbi:MAG: xanthine dehydrogenase family protein subunit M [Vicinamibacterales bacterium]
MLPPFELLRPPTLPEALAILAGGSPHAVPLAGGTNLIVDLRDGRRAPPKLMDVTRLRELKGISADDGRVIVGGGVTIGELLTHPLVATCGRPLRQAAASLGNPLVRNRATVAGNVVNASPAADTAPPLMAMDADVRLVSQRGARSLPLSDFMVGVNETLIAPDELLESIRWPVPPPASAACFYKIGLRKADACSVINGAAMVAWDDAGACSRVRIVIGAAAPRPIRALEAEEALLGRQLVPAAIAEASRLAAGATQPIDDVRATASYRRRMAEVIVRRMLTEIAGAQAGGRTQ